MYIRDLKMNELAIYEDYAIAEEIPDLILEAIFSYLSLKDLRNCALVCKKWYRILSDENNDVWRVQCVKRLVEEVTKSDLLSTVTTYKSKLRAFFHAWNPHDCSRNIYVKPNGFTLHRNPVAQSTDACRGKVGFHYGRHAWEVIWEGPLGTVAVVGISTKDAPLQCQGYVGLLGSDDQSWGWNLVDNHLLHNGDSQGHYPLLNNCPKYQVGERIRVILDCEDNTLAFERNYEFLGVAFRGIDYVFSKTKQRLPSKGMLSSCMSNEDSMLRLPCRAVLQRVLGGVPVGPALVVLCHDPPSDVIKILMEANVPGLPNKKKLYPTVSAVYGNTEVSMVYLGPPVDG